jgi:hypothetical protein
MAIRDPGGQFCDWSQAAIRRDSPTAAAHVQFRTLPPE